MVRYYSTINSNINNNAVGNKDHKDLVLYGSRLRSTQGKRLTREEIANIGLSPGIKGIIVGLILSGGHLCLTTKESKNAIFRLKQSLTHSLYM